MDSALLTYPILSCPILSTGAPKVDRLLGSEDQDRKQGRETEADRDAQDQKKFTELVSLCREFLATAAR
jgi:hypothetical protein